MTKEERLRFIAKSTGGSCLLLNKPKGIYAAAHPEHISVDRRPKPIRRCEWYGWQLKVSEGGTSSGRNVAWVKKPTKKRKRPMGKRERHETHALTKIARQLPAKLPVLTFCPKTRRRL